MGKPLKKLMADEDNIVAPTGPAAMTDKEATDFIWAMRSLYRQRPSDQTVAPIRKPIASNYGNYPKSSKPLYIQPKP